MNAWNNFSVGKGILRKSHRLVILTLAVLQLVVVNLSKEYL